MPHRAKGDYNNPWQDAATGLWYFYDEAEATHGPFPSVARAVQEFRWYLLWLEGMLSEEVVGLLRSNNLTLSDATHEAMMRDVLAASEDFVPALVDEEIDALHREAERQLAADPTPVLDWWWLLAGMVLAAVAWYVHLG